MTTKELDYVVRPASAEPGGADRIVVERAGVRLVAGPPAVFPYEQSVGPRTWERGRYQLYTRVAVENVGTDAVAVDWRAARLIVPGGEAVGLVMAQAASSVGEAGRDRLEPGGRVVRVLMPETLRTIEVDEPLVDLCDRCEYRLEVPVERSGVREWLALAFRLEMEVRPRQRPRFLFWQ